MRKIIVKEGPLVFLRNVFVMEIVAGIFLYAISFLENYEMLYRGFGLVKYIRYDIFLIVVFSGFQLIYVSLLFLDWYFSHFEITEKEIKKMKPKRGEIILLKTKNSRPSKKFNPAFAHINEGAARELKKAGVKAVGIDGPSIRKFRLRPDTVHPLLLKAGIAIVEGLKLDKVRPGTYYYIGLPLKIVGAEGSPVRAVLVR